jgi:hypothetical protein
MIRAKEAKKLAYLLEGVAKGGTIEWFSKTEGKWLPETHLEGLMSAPSITRRVNYCKGSYRPFRACFGDDWQQLVNYSKSQLEGHSPQVEDEAIVQADKYIAELEARNADLELRIADLIMEKGE